MNQGDFGEEMKKSNKDLNPISSYQGVRAILPHSHM
jgi:hypothetical protein